MSAPETALPLLQSTVCIGLEAQYFLGLKEATYDRSLKIVSILLEQLHSLGLSLRPLDNSSSSLGAHIFEDALELILSGRFFCHIQLEFLSFLGVGLCRMIAGLILGGMLAGIGRNLFEKAMDSQGGWRACLVEEGDYIECLMLVFKDHMLAFSSIGIRNNGI